MDKLKETWVDFHEKHPNMMGRFYALMTAVSITMMTIFMRTISKQVHFLVIMPLQATIGSFLAFIIFGFMGQSLYHPDKNISYKLFLRGFLGSIFYMIYHFAIRVLPPQKFVVLANSQPIFVIVFAAFFLNEKPTGTIIALLLVGLVGIVIMVDPGMILPAAWVNRDGLPSASQEYSSYYLALPILCAAAGAGINIFLKAFSSQIHAFHNAGYFFVFAAIYCGLANLLTDIPVAMTQPSIKDLSAIAGAALFQTTFQWFLSLASKYESRAGIVALIMSVQMPLTYVADVWLLGGKLELLNVLGAIVVMTATVLIALSKDRQAK